jgi:hypothetical protein
MKFFNWLRSLLGFNKGGTAPAQKPAEKPEVKPEPKPVPTKVPGPHPFHPTFKVPPGCTHLHPIDVLRSVAGEKEIPGKKDNPLIAHFHEHAGNLGSHSDTNDYSDEVPHCSSALNWVADMTGCRKTNNALAASWLKYNNPRNDDWVEEGDIIVLGTRHVTLCNKRFKWRGPGAAKTFEGFGSNQGNTIKTSIYSVSEINKVGGVQRWQSLKGVVLAPIGTKPIPATGSSNESTR